MYLSGSQNIQKSMNGLLRIRATEIDCDTATIDTINGLQNIDAKIGENIIISTDANQNVQFKSDVSMNYDLDVSGNTKLKNLNVANSTTLYLLNVNEEANFNNNVYVNDATLDVKGTFMNRDMADPTRTMSLYYDPGFSGFRFRNDNFGGYIYFSVLDFAGNMKSFQFNHSQVYSNIKMYIDNTLNQGFGQPFYQGDANSDIGGKIIFVPSTNATDGWQFINRFPGLSFYTNFACADVAGTNYQTFRMNYNNLWSLVPHTFNSSATFNSSLNAGAISCSSITASGNILCSSFRTTGNAQIDGNLNVSSGTAINTIAGISTTFTSPVIVNNTIATNNNITQTATLATNNKIIQPRILGDTTGNANVLKYTQFRFNSNSALGTASAGIQIIDDQNGAQLIMVPNSGGGSYNGMCNVNDRSIISVYGSGQASAVNLLSYGPSGKHGVKVWHDTSSNYSTQIYENNYTFKVNSLTGITASGGVVSSASGEFIVSNSANRGMQILSNSSLSAINPFVGANEAVIATNTQNNSSLVLTTSNSALEHGIRILSNSSTAATITRKVGSNSIITTAVNHTINGPITFATTGVATFSSVPTFDFGFNVGAGNITMNRTDSSYNNITSNNYLAFRSVQNNYWAPNHYFEILDASGNVDLSGNTNINIRGNIILDGSGNLTFPNSTTQTTAYTDTLDTKLNAIGSVVTSSNLTTTVLTTGVATNVGSISLNAGTWIINMNADVEVVTGSTTIGQILACPSTSSSGIGGTSKLAISNMNNVSQAVGNQWTLNSSNVYVPSTTTTYYLIVAGVFGTASRLRFNATNSAFEAYRIG